MNKMNKLLLMLIAMMAIMILALGIDKAYDYLQDLKWEKERVKAYEQARLDIENIQMTIEELSADPEALTAYMEENELHYVNAVKENTSREVDDTEHFVSESTILDAYVSDNSILDNRISDNRVSGNSISGNDVLGNSVSGNNVSGNSISGNDVLGNSVSGNSVSGNNVSGNSISGNDVLDNSISGNDVSQNAGVEITVSDNSLVKRQISASYVETIRINQQDKQIISENQIDFSKMKIACLGDSITAGTNLNKQKDGMQYTYPRQLAEILQAAEVMNLGIGGSSIGRYWENAFVDRYRKIPKDVDIILVMGGTNDGFCATQKEFGSLSERKKGTFTGDLDELLKGLKKHYPDAMVVLATPLSNVLHDMLRKENANLLPQSDFAEAMTVLANEYEVPVIDLYQLRILDTHDAAVIHNFMPDGVHGNAAGYRILAQHMAAELIQLYEGMEDEMSCRINMNNIQMKN